MSVKRTGKIQSEKTATGYITTAEEIVRKEGKKYTRWVQIGYTSTEPKDTNNKIKEEINNG